MRMRATVKHATKDYEAYYGTIKHDPLRLVKTERIPCPAYLELIEEIERGVKSYMIYYYDKEGKCLTDSWCETLQAAKEKARIEFDLSEEDWELIEE